MTQRAYFFDATSGSPSYSAADFNRVLGWFRGEGVLPGHLNELEVYADSSGMQVKVRSGRALLDPKNNYSAAGLFESDAQETLAIGAASPTYPRIDRVVVRRTAANKDIALAVLQGTPAANPTPPTLTRSSSVYELSLAQVRVEAGAVTIAPDKVTDERSDSTVCGWADFTARKVAAPSGKDLSVEGDQVIVKLGDAAGTKKLLVRDSTGATVFSIDSDGRVEVGNIRNAAIGDGQITAAKLAGGAVGTDMLADGAVTSAKIADGTIVDSDISASAAIAQSKVSNASRAIDADKVDGYHAGTGASQVLVLDSSGKVPLANIPTPLTGKDADTVDGSHASAFANASDMSDFMQSKSIQTSTSWTIPTSWGDVSGLSLSVTLSQTCDLFIYAAVTVSPTQATQHNIRAVVDSTPMDVHSDYVQGGGCLVSGHWYFGGVGAGTHTVKVQMEAGAANQTAVNRRLSVMVVPK